MGIWEGKEPRDMRSLISESLLAHIRASRKLFEGAEVLGNEFLSRYRGRKGIFEAGPAGGSL